MSEMEVFHGYFRESSDQNIEIEDTDEYYEFEKKNGKEFVRVDGVVYEYWKSDYPIDNYGGSFVSAPSKYPQLFCHWYNGGASLKEVVEEAIREYFL